MKQQLRSLYGLKWNPFTSEIPIDGIVRSEKWEQMFWRIENLVMDGGFAMIQGDSGLGKSILMRALFERLSKVRDVQVQTLSRPQSSISDFYRELGVLFNVAITSSNRWGGFSKVRERWQELINAAMFRPVLLIDEAQEMQPAVLSELRLLTSKQFDSQILLTVVLAGDLRLAEKLKLPDLIPLGTRVRTRMLLEPQTKDELVRLLEGLTDGAGCPHLLTTELKNLLAEHALQNPRIMMTHAAEILNLAVEKEVKQLDVDLFFELYPLPTSRSRRRQ